MVFLISDLDLKKEMVWEIGHGDIGILRRKGRGDGVLVLFFNQKRS